MPDNVQIGVGNGPSMITDDVGGGVQIPLTKLDVGSHGVSSRVYSRGLPGRVPARLTRDWVRSSVTISPTVGLTYAYYNQLVGGMVTFPNVFNSNNQFGTLEQITYGYLPAFPPNFNPEIFFFSAPLTSAGIADGFSTPLLNQSDRLNMLGHMYLSDGGLGNTCTSMAFTGSFSMPVSSSDHNLYALIRSTYYYGTTWSSPASLIFSIVVRRD